MCSVAWCSITWEAFATLVAGLVAVGGAIVIWFRQQTILEHQTTIERLKLRSDTFDRRWEIYQATVNWLREWFETGDRPAPEIDSAFVWAIEKSKFLFRPAVTSQLTEWHMMALNLQILNRQMSGRVDEVQRMALAAEAVNLAGQLESAFSIVGELFAQEMQLSDSEAQLPPLRKNVDQVETG